jgi:hypothetical protein
MLVIQYLSKSSDFDSTLRSFLAPSFLRPTLGHEEESAARGYSGRRQPPFLGVPGMHEMPSRRAVEYSIRILTNERYFLVLSAGKRYPRQCTLLESDKSFLTPNGAFHVP